MRLTEYRLPRYVFKATKVGCGGLNHEDHCLCDVLVGAPAPIHTGNLMFATVALDEMDDDVVSSRNIIEFASILLGCYERFLRCPVEQLTPYETYDNPTQITMEAEVGTRRQYQRKTAKTTPKRNETPVTLGSVSQTTRTLDAPSTEWLMLDDDIQKHLTFHYRCGTPWSVLEHLVPSSFTDTQFKRLRAEYKFKRRSYLGSQRYLAKRKVSA